MARWLHTFALLVIAAVLANAQCSAACLVSDSPGATGQHSACCAEHHSSPEHSHTGCQHKHSTLRDAECGGTELCKASSFYLPGGSDSIVTANIATVFTALPIPSVLMPVNSHGTPPKLPLLLVLSVLRI